MRISEGVFVRLCAVRNRNSPELIGITGSARKHNEEKVDSV